MVPIGPNTTADLFFQLTWHSPNVRHTDAYAGHAVNFWRDLLPRRVYADLMEHLPGDRLESGIVGVNIIDSGTGYSTAPTFPLRTLGEGGAGSDGSTGGKAARWRIRRSSVWISFSNSTRTLCKSSQSRF